MQAKRGCRTCVWRLVNAGNSKEYHCGYSLCLTHHSRIWLHYQRTGRESLEGMTFDTNCTEWMHGNPRAKLSLLQDNPGARQLAKTSDQQTGSQAAVGRLWR